MKNRHSLSKILYSLALLAGATVISGSIEASAQVLRLDEDFFNNRLARAQATVVDSTTLSPIPFASVFLVPLKDTTITHFGLTDTLGKASLKDIPYGGYTLSIEMMGYVPVRKETYFRTQNVDFGTIKMKVDQNFIEAAVVSEIGNAITIAKDTVTINATAFRVGSGAMLRDLLRTMPGMEVGEDGTVKFNGETIDKITVGGKTFFFNDKSAALNNLPASIVDKIRVIDDKSDKEKITGIVDDNKTKVMDVELKKEFQEGWFGNVRALGGTTIGHNEEEKDFETVKPSVLFNSNAMVAGYNEQDQLTLIANGSNVDYGQSGTMVIVGRSSSSLDQAEASPIGGLSTAWKGGVNYTTTRLKDFESTAAINIGGDASVNEVMRNRTTFATEGDILQDSRTRSDQHTRNYSASIELKNETSKKYYLNFRAGAARTFGQLNSDESIVTSDALHSWASVGENISSGNSMKNSLNGSMYFGLKELGKKRRSLSFNLSGVYQDLDGTQMTSSILGNALSSSVATPRALSFVNTGKMHSLSTGFSYNEPLGKLFTLSLGGDYSTTSRIVRKDASFTASGIEDPTSSSYSENGQDRLNGDARINYRKDAFSAGLGLSAQGLKEKILSESGTLSTKYDGDMVLTVSPSINLNYSKSGKRYSFSIIGFNQSIPQSNRDISLNTENLSSLHTGNPYLKEPYQYYSYLQINYNNPKTLQNAYLYGSMNLTANPITSARWYTSSGVLNYFPVNSPTPSISSLLQGSFTTPLNKKRTLSLTIDAGARYTAQTYFMNVKSLEGFDPDDFNHSAFMAKVWGDERGSIFYGNGSYFGKNETRYIRPNMSLNLKVNLEALVMNAGVSAYADFSNYESAVRENSTFSLRPSADATYITKWDMDIKTDISYNLFWGYAEGYTRPEFIWNLTVNKSVKSFTFTLSLHDILAQTYSLNHTVTGGYVEDSLSLILGRYFLAGLRWNFGKMNQTQASRARNAQLNLPILF